MKTLRKAAERFHTKIDWLDSWHSFSFGEHHDDRHMGFGPLRVINEDRVRGGAGFPTHGHRDMEIITVVLKGALQHKDNTGGGSVIKPGDVQKMSAGSGILHSEFNSSARQEVHLLQIWIIPNKTGVKPGYVQLHFEPQQMRDRFCLVAGPEDSLPSPFYQGEEQGGGLYPPQGSKLDPHPNPPPFKEREEIIPIYQDARLSIADLSVGKSLDYAAQPGRKIWVQMATGDAEVSGVALRAGDGLAVEDERALTFTAKAESKMLLFDMG